MLHIQHNNTCNIFYTMKIKQIKYSKQAFIIWPNGVKK